MKKSMLGRAVLVVCLCVAAAGLVAGCGGGSSTGGGGGGSVNETDLSKYKDELAELIKGTYAEPEGPTVNPPPGKNISVISVGQSIETSQNASAAMAEAGKSLGWNVNVFDGKFESSRELSGIQQALASGADGIVLLYVDCAAVKAGLLQAKNEEVPVVGIESLDCKPSLETNVKFLEDQSFKEWEHGWGQSQMAWVIAKTEGQAKVITTEESDLAVTRYQAEGWREKVEECPTCEIVENAHFVGTEYGPQLQQKIEQALISNPDANGFIATVDGVMTSGGGAAALRASGRQSEIKVMGGEGSKQGIELIRNGTIGACSGISTPWTGYEAMAVLARIYSGKDPKEGNSGIGYQICEEGHNMPPEGESWEPPIDFVAAYEKMWGLK
jgi:ribose transport system substrate-binding protein